GRRKSRDDKTGCHPGYGWQPVLGQSLLRFVGWSQLNVFHGQLAFGFNQGELTSVGSGLEVLETSLELGYLCSRSVDLAREHLGTLLDLGIRLGLADTRKRYANQRQYCWIGTLYRGSQVFGAWPLGQVYRSGA